MMKKGTKVLFHPVKERDQIHPTVYGPELIPGVLVWDQDPELFSVVAEGFTHNYIDNEQVFPADGVDKNAV
jgi:hypothetical protein